MPRSANRILEVGCAEGRLGAALKDQDRTRTVYGIERVESVARVASRNLDKVFQLDVESQFPDIEEASLDCILYGDVLEHLLDPLKVLRRHAPLLKPDGQILCCLPNVQHFSVISSIIAGDFQYESEGLLDATHLRFFTYSTIIKMLLDAGYAPQLAAKIGVRADNTLLNAAQPLIQALGLDQQRANDYLNTYQYIFRGIPLNWERSENTTPLTFVACVNNEEQLRSNLLRSPCLQNPSKHELLLVRGASNAAEGLNAAIAQAKNEIVVLLHQDVYLPEGWSNRFLQQYSIAEQRFGRVGLAGLFGSLSYHGNRKNFGHIVDRDTLLQHTPLPAAVDTIDEAVMAMPKSNAARFDPRLGWHLYGADLAMQSMQRGYFVAALDAPCFHHSRTGFSLPAEYQLSAEIFKQKWNDYLPIFTPCSAFLR